MGTPKRATEQNGPRHKIVYPRTKSQTLSHNGNDIKNKVQKELFFCTLVLIFCIYTSIIMLVLIK